MSVTTTAPPPAAHDEDRETSVILEAKDRLTAIGARLRRPVGVLACLAALLWPLAYGPDKALAWYTGHLTYALNLLIPALVCLQRGRINRARREHVRTLKSRAHKFPGPPNRAAGGELIELILGVDRPLARLVHLAAIAAALATPILWPVTVATLRALPHTPAAANTLTYSLAGPLLGWAWLLLRAHHVGRLRRAALTGIFDIAKEYFSYPAQLPGKPSAVDIQLSIPHLAVVVTAWRSLIEIDTAAIRLPTKLSVTDEGTWAQFTINLEERLPRPEGWRVRRSPRHDYAMIGPADYPLLVLWEGEYDPSPLVFFTAQSLRTGKRQLVTLADAAAHALCTGAMRTGKSTFAEVIAAQAVRKPMPWDPSLRATVHIKDPKGTMARRWRGRPHVIVSDGSVDATGQVDDDGDSMTGIRVMAAHTALIDQELQRRAAILAKYPECGTWVALPDDVKAHEGFAPLIEVADEYLDHADPIIGTSSLAQKERDARLYITSTGDMHMRKYANVGYHRITIAHEATIKALGAGLVRMSTIRVLAGNPTDRQTFSNMFATRNVPALAASCLDEEKTAAAGESVRAPIPGRARIMAMPGAPIEPVQILAFGGAANMDTLDRYVPRTRFLPANGDFTMPTWDDFDPTVGDQPAPAPAPTAHPAPADPPTLSFPAVTPAEPTGDPSAIFPAGPAPTPEPPAGAPPPLDPDDQLDAVIYELEAAIVDAGLESDLQMIVGTTDADEPLVEVRTIHHSLIMKVTCAAGGVVTTSSSGSVRGEYAMPRAREIIAARAERLESRPSPDAARGAGGAV